MADKVLHEKELNSGYTIQVVLYTQNEGPLAVKLENKDGDFIGQTFVSLDNINEEIEVYSNGEYTIPADELAKLEKEVSAELGSKPKTESFASRWISGRDIANAKLSKFI